MMLTPSTRFCTSKIISRNSMIEQLEGRELLSAVPAVPAHVPKDVIPPIIKKLEHQQHGKATLPIHVISVTSNGGQLVATGLIGNNPFTAPITLSVVPAVQNAAAASAATPAVITQVLNLHLGPINLDVLGLQVKTSQICLDVSATSGPGNLLGNLLTSIANLLNGGTSLGSILGGLTGSQLTTLLNGLTGLLNGLLGNLTAPASLGTATGTVGLPAGTTNILHLALGPVDLHLLGLNVHADNCANGPITVDVNAVTGPGNLLGNLLTSLSNALNGLNNPTQAQQILDRIIGNILQLI